MKVGERTQTPPQPVKDKAAEKLQGETQAQQMVQRIQEKNQPPKAPISPGHLGQTLDIKG